SRHGKHVGGGEDGGKVRTVNREIICPGGRVKHGGRGDGEVVISQNGGGLKRGKSGGAGRRMKLSGGESVTGARQPRFIFYIRIVGRGERRRINCIRRIRPVRRRRRGRVLVSDRIGVRKSIPRNPAVQSRGIAFGHVPGTRDVDAIGMHVVG